MGVPIGTRWKSQVCSTEVVVTRTTAGEAQLECGGHSMVPANEPSGADLAPDNACLGGSLLGKRYGDDETGVEVLCTKAGEGSIAVSGRVLDVRALKSLPSSD